MRPAILFIILLCIQLSVFAQSHVRFPILHKSKVYRCGWRRGDLIGVGYDLRNNLVAIKVHTMPLPIHTGVVTNIDFRIPRRGNSYFDLDVTKKNLWGAADGKLAASFQYKRIFADHQKITEQFNVGSGLLNWNSFIILAYARQTQQRHDVNISSNGVMIKFYKRFLYQLDVSASTIYWFDQMQYSLRIREHLSRGKLVVGAGWEKVNDWEGFDVELLVLVR